MPRALRRSLSPPARISVIVATYQRADTITRTIESILAQDRPAHEIIVVDDGSTDDTANRVAPFEPTVRYVRQDNRERGAARNLGASLANGSHVAFIDSDDTWTRGHLAVLGAAMDETTPVAYTRAEYVYADGATKRHGGPYPDGKVTRALLHGNFVALHSAAVSLSAFRRVGGFPEDRQMATFEDWALWLALSLSFPFVHVPQVTARIHVHSGRSMNDARKVEVASRRFVDHLLSDPSTAALRPMAGHVRAAGEVAIALACYRAHDGAGARRAIAAALRSDPGAVRDRRLAATFAKSLVGRSTVERVRRALRLRQP